MDKIFVCSKTSHIFERAQVQLCILRGAALSYKMVLNRKGGGVVFKKVEQNQDSCDNPQAKALPSMTQNIVSNIK